MPLSNTVRRKNFDDSHSFTPGRPFNQAENPSNRVSGAVGAGALFATTADQNTATGAGALFSNSTGPFNTANGTLALFSNTTGSGNTANGINALEVNTHGGGNVAVGASALFANTTGSHNTALGDGAGASLTTRDNNINIGYNVQGGAGDTNTIRIGNSDISFTFIHGISGAAISSGATVLVASNGMLGTVVSSKRFKDEIKPMDKASEPLLSLKPVTFRYKKEIDPAGIQQFGLVAEDVEKVNPNLVVRDADGKAYTVRYEQINAMLLNEFLKEHRKVEQLEARLTQQEKDFTARLKEQDAKIQQVSNNIALGKPALQVVNDR
jgi:hypothetical protein